MCRSNRWLLFIKYFTKFKSFIKVIKVMKRSCLSSLDPTCLKKSGKKDIPVAPNLLKV